MDHAENRQREHFVNINIDDIPFPYSELFVVILSIGLLHLVLCSMLPAYKYGRVISASVHTLPNQLFSPPA
jgi:hypothetical protein